MLALRIAADLDRLVADNPDACGPVPAELLTASGGGLDPHLSPAAAAWQVPRIAKVRGAAEPRIQAVIDGATTGRTFGVLGEPHVDVLAVNLALDRAFGHPEQHR
jgi:K+-transporting ATPase ATPase C chain